ncbi:MAG: flavodoxin family protein [Betaproteobacteria bacterium]|nr:flavodoxin family protein [Betaproteobacteria bacterium]
MNGRNERLLIVANTPSANTEKLARAVQKGAAEHGAAAALLSPPEAGADDVLAAAAIIVGTTENFGYMSGQIKDFFERIYYPCLEKTRALPWALYVRAGKDGAGTLRAVQSITAGLRWRQMQPPLLLRGEWRDSFAEECETLGAAVAAGLAAGIF